MPGRGADNSQVSDRREVYEDELRNERGRFILPGKQEMSGRQSVCVHMCVCVCVKV